LHLWPVGYGLKFTGGMRLINHLSGVPLLL